MVLQVGAGRKEIEKTLQGWKRGGGEGFNNKHDPHEEKIIGKA